MNNLDELFLITPQEAVEQSPYNSTMGTMHFANKVLNEFYKSYPSEAKPLLKADYLMQFLEFMSILFNAGRVQGIREERKKRGNALSDNYIDRDNLTMAAVYLGSAKAIHDDITGRLIDCCNPEKENADMWIYAYKEIRAKSNAICMLHNQLKGLLSENGISM